MEFTRGDTYRFKFQRKDADGNAITTIADKLWFSVKKDYYTKKLLFQKRLDNETITFDEEGYYHITINPDDTESLVYGKYVYDIQVEDTGYKFTISKGDMIITEEVTFKENEV